MLDGGWKVGKIRYLTLTLINIEIYGAKMQFPIAYPNIFCSEMIHSIAHSSKKNI